MRADLALAFELADSAARISMRRYRDRDFTTTLKADGSPVTDADLEIELTLRERIARRRPNHAVIGEECGRSGLSEWCWYLDPIDGTSRFVAGDPLWMTLIALAHQDTVVVGVADFPALRERWWASRGHGAYHDGDPIHVSSTRPLSAAVINDDWRQTLVQQTPNHPLCAVASQGGRLRLDHGHSFLAVAAGLADVAIGIGGYAWDYAAPQIIVREAGGLFTDFDGIARIDARRAVLTNGVVHPEVLSVLRRNAGRVGF